MIFAMFRRSGTERVIDRLHGDIVAAVRQPSLYADYGVNDTFEGRFELLTLFATLQQATSIQPNDAKKYLSQIEGRSCTKTLAWASPTEVTRFSRSRSTPLK